MNSLFNQFHKKSFHKAFLFLLSAFVFVSFVINYRAIQINPDSVYYIGVSRLISEGKVPFIDFQLSYTPLSFYLMCIPLSLLGPTYTNALIIVYVLNFINSFLVYKILRLQNCTTLWSWYGSLLFLLCCLLFQGNVYILEPFVLLFGLVALCFLHNGTIFFLILTGISCSLSFLCKQYGMGFLVLVIIFLIIKDNYSFRSVKKILLVLSGFFIGLVAFVIFMKLQGVEFVNMTSELSGSDYHREGFKGFLIAYFYLFTRLSPLLIALFFALKYLKKVVKDHFWVISVVGTFGFMLACYVRFYSHYLLLVSPFVVFLIVYTINQIENRKIRKIFSFYVILSTFIPICLVLFSTINTFGGKRRQLQVQTSVKIANVIPEGQENVFVSFSVLYASLLNNYTPPLIKKYGLSSGFVTTKKGIKEMLSDAEFSIISEKELNGNSPINSPLVKEFLEDNFNLEVVVPNDVTGDILLYKRK